MWRNLNKTNKEMNKRNRLHNRLLMRKKNKSMKIITMINRNNKRKNKLLILMIRAIIRPPMAKKQLKNKRSPPSLPNN